jgi:hypothetical protein
MTWDFALGHQCPHVIVEERAVLSSDRRSLRLTQPVASAEAIRITASGGTGIPKEGALSFAELRASKSGPYTVLAGRTELVIACRDGELSTNLPVQSRLPSATALRQIQEIIRSKGLGIEAELSEGGFLVFRELLTGPGGFVRVDGAAASSLGFATQVQARGQVVYPAWDLADDGQEFLLGGTGQGKKLRVRFPRFATPIRQSSEFLVTYITYEQWCRRCQGYGQETDIRATQGGEYADVRNEDLLVQDLIKITATERGSNPFFTAYGTSLLAQIGTKSTGASRAAIVEDLSKALGLYQRLQRNQRQALTPRQTLRAVAAIQTDAFPLDPRVVDIKVTATTASGEPIQITTQFAPPGVTSLVGNAS